MFPGFVPLCCSSLSSHILVLQVHLYFQTTFHYLEATTGSFCFTDLYIEVQEDLLTLSETSQL